MTVGQIYVVTMFLGFLVAVLSKRSHLLNIRPRLGRIVSTMGVLAAAAVVLVFFSPEIGGALLGFCTAMSHGAAGTVLGSWLRLSMNKEEYLRRQAYQQRYGELVTQHELTEVAPDEMLYSNYGKGTFVLWCCLSSLLGPLVIFLGGARTGFRSSDVMSELFVLVVALVASGTLIFFGYRLWSARLEQAAEQPFSRI